MTGFNRIGEVGIPTELRRQKSLGEITVHGRLLPPPSRPSQPLRRTLSTLTIIPATPSVAPPVHSRRNTVSDFDFDTPKKRQPAIAPTPHRSEDINTENDDPKKQYGPVGLGRRTRTKSGDEYTSLQDVSRSRMTSETVYSYFMRTDARIVWLYRYEDHHSPHLESPLVEERHPLYVHHTVSQAPFTFHRLSTQLAQHPTQRRRRYRGEWR